MKVMFQRVRDPDEERELTVGQLHAMGRGATLMLDLNFIGGRGCVWTKEGKGAAIWCYKPTQSRVTAAYLVKLANDKGLSGTLTSGSGSW